MKWPWITAKRLERAQETARKVLDKQADEIQSLKDARDIRDAEILSLRKDARVLDSIEAVSGLYAEKHAGETWREYDRRILLAFKEGADSTLLKAVIDEIGRHERQGFVDCVGFKDASDLMRQMGGIEMARTLKERLLTLTGRYDQLTAKDKERHLRAQAAFSDTEDQILGQEVLDGRIPKR